MAKKKKSADNANLDSFLDTLFNVAGILVIIIALTQITAKEKIKKTADEEQTGNVSKQQVARAEKELEQLTRNFLAGQVAYRNKDRELSGLTNDFANLSTNYGVIESEVLSHGEYTPPSVLEGNVSELKKEADDLNQTLVNTGTSLELIRSFKDWSKLHNQLIAAQKEFDGNQTELNESSDDLDNHKKEMVASRKKIEDLERGKKAAEDRKILDDLLQKKKVDEEMLAKLEREEDKLEEHKKMVEQGPINVRIPVPEKIDTKKFKIRDWLINGGQLFDGSVADEMWNKWQREYQDWLKVHREFGDDADDIHRKLRTAYLLDRLDGPKLTNDQFVIDLTNYPKGGAKVTPRAGRGVPVVRALRKDSGFRRAIRLLDVDSRWAYFWVYEDSFKHYGSFQEIVQEKGLKNGWAPMKTGNGLFYGGSPDGAQ